MGHRFTSTALAALMLGVATPVIAQSTEAVRTFNIGAGPLERSLPVFAQQSGLQILYPSALVAGRQARALTGDYTPEAALAELLRGTGLTYRQSRPTVFVLVDPSARAEVEPEATQLEEVVVTGTYLRGAESPSPVTVITQDDVARQGRATVAARHVRPSSRCLDPLKERLPRLAASRVSCAFILSDVFGYSFERGG